MEILKGENSMSRKGAEAIIDERNYYSKKTRTEYEFNHLALKCSMLVTALVITNVITLLLLLLAYIPLPTLK